MTTIRHWNWNIPALSEKNQHLGYGFNQCVLYRMVNMQFLDICSCEISTGLHFCFFRCSLYWRKISNKQFNIFRFGHCICVCNALRSVFLKRGEFSADYHFVCITSAAKNNQGKNDNGISVYQQDCQGAYY